MPDVRTHLRQHPRVSRRHPRYPEQAFRTTHPLLDNIRASSRRLRVAVSADPDIWLGLVIAVLIVLATIWFLP